MAAKLSVFVDWNNDQLTALHCLANLHKIPYESRFIAISNSCTTTERLYVTVSMRRTVLLSIHNKGLVKK